MQLRKVILVLGGALTAWACGAAEGDDPALFEDPGSVEQGIMKGFPGAVNGQYNYCYNPSALCVSGEGDCNSNAQCVAGLICGQDNGAKFGFAAGSDVCIPSYCQNKKLDAAQGETQIDCGGPCGTVCPTVVCPPVGEGWIRRHRPVYTGVITGVTAPVSGSVVSPVLRRTVHVSAIRRSAKR